MTFVYRNKQTTQCLTQRKDSLNFWLWYEDLIVAAELTAVNRGLEHTPAAHLRQPPRLQMNIWGSIWSCDSQYNKHSSLFVQFLWLYNHNWHCFFRGQRWCYLFMLTEKKKMYPCSLLTLWSFCARPREHLPVSTRPYPCSPALSMVLGSSKKIQDTDTSTWQKSHRPLFREFGSRKAGYDQFSHNIPLVLSNPPNAQPYQGWWACWQVPSNCGS